ncbi:nucleotidyltransferase domain-containing protein [Kribbella sp. NPDC004138]
MDLSHPISTVIPTLDGPVLTVLSRTTQPLTGRKVHQLASTASESGTRKVLRRLASTGLVSATEVGSAVQYALNRDHLAASAVLELTNLRQKLIQRIHDAIDTEWSKPPIHASLFGSAARGDGDLHSDIDLLVVHNSAELPPEWDDQVGSLAEQVHSWTGNHLQVYELSHSALLAHFASGDPIVNDWLRDSVTVFGPDFRQLRNRITHGPAPQ